MAPALTTTSYAILGLLAVKPWTTYELARQMDRALGRFWPRSESKLYEEPKKLVELGLARASSERVGKRPRTVYTITAKGRRALAAWVPTPGAGPVLEFEQLVKVFFAEHATKDDLLATIADVRRWSDEQLRASAGVPQGYVDGTGPFPERLPWLVLVGKFLFDFLITVERWAEWAGELVESWPDDLSAAEPDQATLETMAVVTRAHVGGAAPRGGAPDTNDRDRAAEDTGATTRVLLVSGSLRRLSTNTAVLRTAQAAAPRDVTAVRYDKLGELPAFDPDDDVDPLPPAVADLRGEIRRADGVLFSVPEYAGGLPGSFKNLLDWAIGDDRPGSISEKPVAWINASVRSAADAHDSLRTVLGYANAHIVDAACSRIPVSAAAIDDDGTINDPSLRHAIAESLTVLAAFARGTDR